MLADVESRAVAAVIVHYGAEEPTLGVVHDVLSGTLPPDTVLVINNGPSEWMSDVPVRTCVIGPGVNRGYAGAINRAVEEARARLIDVLWILNNDVAVRPSALDALMAAYRMRPDADVIGSFVTAAEKIWFGGGSFNPWTGRATHDLFGDPVETPHLPEVTSTDWINGCSMLIPVAAFDSRGMFDERLFLYKEELEWQIRYPRAAAYLVTEVLLDHAVGGTTGSTERPLGRTFMARNGLILALRQRGIRRLAWLATWAWDYLVRPTLRLDASALRDHLRGARSRRECPPGLLERLR